MAGKASVRKVIRKTAAKSSRNKAQRSRVKTFVRRVERAVDSGDMETAGGALGDAQTVLARAGRKGIIPKRRASRKISRLVRRVRSMPLESPST